MQSVPHCAVLPGATSDVGPDVSAADARVGVCLRDVSYSPTALLLAAGRGERMRPLTDVMPKPLLPVRGRPLLDWHLAALHAAGVRRAVVNTGWLGEQIPASLSVRWSGVMELAYSREDVDFGRALETAGGIARALPLLPPVFWLVAGDVFAPGFAFAADDYAAFVAGDDLAHLWLVPNPVHNPAGDFGLLESHPGSGTGRAVNMGLAQASEPAGQQAGAHAGGWCAAELPAEHPGSPAARVGGQGDVGLAAGAGALPRYTYSTVALLRAELFSPPWCDIPPGNPQGVAAALAPLLRRAMDAGRVGATLYTGQWTDVGTPGRLAALNEG